MFWKSKKQYDPVKQYFLIKKQIAIASLACLIGVSGLVIWKDFQISSIKHDSAMEVESLKRDAYDDLEDSRREFLKVLARPYVWAVKSAMKQDNLYKIDLYGNSIANSAKFISVMVVNERGTVISATNDRYEGKYFISFDSPYYLQVDRTIVYKASANALTMASPIIDEGVKQGTLIIRYSLADQELFLIQ